MSADADIPRVSSEESRRSRVLRATVIITSLLALVVAFDLYINMSSGTPVMYQLYRRLYYVPVLYAAFVFGRRGALLAALAASVPFVAHLTFDNGAPFSVGDVEGVLEVVMYFVIGFLFGTLRDMEERKTSDLRQVSGRLEEAYRKLEERAIQLINIQDYTQSILRSITSGVLTVGPDGSVTTVNPAAERLLGMSEHEMVPRPIGSLFRNDGGIEGDVGKVLSGRIPLAMREVTVVSNADREVHVQASTSRMRAVGGRILGAVVTIEDVSEIKALTEQLIRADRLAAMGELTAGVAHEVRNPLGVIRASVQLLEDAGGDQARIAEASDVIKQEIDRLDKVIKALLDFGRPSKPTMLRTEPVEVLRDVVLFTSRFADQSGVRIVEELPDGLPRVLADPDQLKQVFLNLITNAVQAMDEQGGGVITLGARREGDYLALSVKDDGPGIPPEEISKVFDPFYSTRDAGTGLGLTIVHRIIDEHGGHIEVESGEDGTEITVAVPVAVERDDSEDIS